MNQNLQQAVDLLNRTKDATLVAVRPGFHHTDGGIGVKPIMARLREDKRFFAGCAVADTVIGKAAALLLVLSGAEAVYGRIMSKSAAELLEQKGIPWACGQQVEFIENRTRDGMCPMEASVLHTKDPEEAFGCIEATIARLMAAKA